MVSWGRLIEDDGSRNNFPKGPSLNEDHGYIITQRADGENEGEQWIDGNSAGTVDYGGTLQDWSEFGIGRQGSESWDGDIAEVIVYEHALSTSERNDVENYLSKKYT